MATVWFSKPVACCHGIDRTCSILKNNRTYRLDIIYSDVCYVSSNIYSIGSEVYRISTECIVLVRLHSLVDGLQLIVATPVDGTWCISSIQLLEETLLC